MRCIFVVILYWTSEKTSISLRVQELSLFNFVCMYSGNNESSGLYNYACLMGSGSELVIGLQFNMDKLLG